MTTEYWLQKKTIGGWSHVTWYDNQTQALENFNRASSGNSGYSWRLVSVEVMHEKLLEEVVQVEAPSVEQTAKANVWGGNEKAWEKANTDSWGKPISNGWADLPADSQRAEHGMTGKVWLVNHAEKSRVRVAPDEVQRYLDSGYERGGPKTAFRT